MKSKKVIKIGDIISDVCKPEKGHGIIIDIESVMEWLIEARILWPSGIISKEAINYLEVING